MTTKFFCLAIITVSFACTNLPAQDQQVISQVKEVGIGFASLNSFSLQYRWGNDKRLFRLSGNIGGTTSSENSSPVQTTVQDTININSTTIEKTTTPVNLTCGLSFSVLKIKSITEKFGFVCGGITAFNYIINQRNSEITTTNVSNSSTLNSTVAQTQKSNSQTLQPSIGIVLGAVYRINPSFMIYGEVAPNIYYSYNKTTTKYTSATTSGNYNSSMTNDIPRTTNYFGLSNLGNSGAMLTVAYRFTK